MPSTCHECQQPLPDNPDGEPALCPACAFRMAATATSETQAMPSPLPGLPQVEGHIILDELARGGMGVVYKARQLDPDREVALKMLLPLDEGRPDLRERFRVEIRALAELDHPGILPLYQVGSTDGRPWFTMKLAAGGTLASRLGRKHKPYDPRAAAALVAGLADAVFHAHTHGVLHRDIKPANILFDERGDPFLADFGLARLLDSTVHVTRSNAVIGTPCYIAPEVATIGAKEATTASDIYGLGAVLYELLSGRPPFIVEGYAALMKKIADDMPERPSTLASNVPRDLELISLTCLAKDPRQRYTSAKDLADDLRRWLNGEPIAARRASATVRLVAWAKRRPAIAALSAALIATVLTAGTWLALTGYQLRRSLAAEKEASGRAEHHSEFFIGRFADQLEKMGRLSLIEEACAEASALDTATDDPGQMRRARLLLRWASALWAKGDGTAATPKIREAMESMDALLTRQPKDQQAFTLALQSRCRLAEVLADTTSFSDAITLLDKADADIGRPGILPLDDTLRLQAETDRTRALIWTRHRRDEPETAIAAANRAVTSFSAWQARAPGERERTLALAEALREAGKAWYHGSGEHPDPLNLEKALPLFTAGANLLRTLPARTPDENFELAYAAGWMGDTLLRMEGKGPTAAEPLHKEEFDLITTLTNRDPLNGEWQHKLANSYLSLAEASRDARDAEQAETHWTTCRTILKNLHEEAPLVRSWALSYLNALRRDGLRALKNKKPADAAPLLETCAAIAAGRVKAMPDSSTERECWRDTTDEIAGTLARAGAPARASEVSRRAADLAQTAVARPGPSQAWWEWTLLHYQRQTVTNSESTITLAAWLTANLSQLEQRAATAGTRAATMPDSIPECNVWKDLTDEIGKALEDQKDWPRALATYRTARDLARPLASLPGPGQLWWEWTLAHYHRRVAYASKQTGALPDWLAENLPALEIRVRHLRNGSPFARKDPEAVANAFLVTIDSQLANQQPAAALANATRCLDLYLECHATAGPAHEWAKALLNALETAKKVPAHSADAAALATRAAHELYPASSRPALDEKDSAAAAALDGLAPPP